MLDMAIDGKPLPQSALGHTENALITSGVTAARSSPMVGAARLSIETETHCCSQNRGSPAKRHDVTPSQEQPGGASATAHVVVRHASASVAQNKQARTAVDSQQRKPALSFMSEATRSYDELPQAQTMRSPFHRWHQYFAALMLSVGVLTA